MSESFFERIDFGSISNFLVVTGKKEFENLTDEDIYEVNILLFLVLRFIGAAKQGIYVFTSGLVLPVNIFWKTERLKYCSVSSITVYWSGKAGHKYFY